MNETLDILNTPVGGPYALFFVHIAAVMGMGHLMSGMVALLRAYHRYPVARERFSPWLRYLLPVGILFAVGSIVGVLGAVLKANPNEGEQLALTLGRLLDYGGQGASAFIAGIALWWFEDNIETAHAVRHGQQQEEGAQK